MSDENEGKPASRRALLWLDGPLAPVLGTVLYEARDRAARRSPAQAAEINSLIEDFERQLREQYPDLCWLFNHHRD